MKHFPWGSGNAFWIKGLVILHQHHILCASSCLFPPGQHWTRSGTVKAKQLQSAFLKKKQGFWIWHILNTENLQKQV